MFQRVAFMSVTLALALSFIFVGCGSDSTGPGDTGPPPADFSGNWALAGEVIARQVCDNNIGDTRDWNAVITQDGSTATISIGGGPPTDLTVDGSTATGSKTDGEMLDFALTITDGELGGTITATNNSIPCTEVWSVIGTRTNTAPSSDFEGSWDFDITVTGESPNCDGGLIGSVDQVCLSIEVDGNTVSIDDGEGIIAGVGDGNTAFLTRVSEGELLEVTITVSGNSISGVATFHDPVTQCEITSSISGTRRTTPCPPPPAPGGDFEGFWNITGEFITNTCGFEISPACSEFVQSGNTVTIVDDGLQGTVSGNTLTIHEEIVDEIVKATIDIVIEISSDGNSISGTQSITVEDLTNPENSCAAVATMSGTRTSSCNPASPGLRIMVPPRDR